MLGNFSMTPRDTIQENRGNNELPTITQCEPKLSNYVTHHNRYQDVFKPRKKLLHFACSHIKEILVNALDYTHEVGHDG